MQLKLVAQTRDTITYKVTGSITTRRGASGFDLTNYQWPYI